MRRRILGAAFKSCVEKGYAGRSTLEIATRAKVSKRDLYASVGNKYAARLMAEVAHPAVIATFRLAIAEATRSPEIAQALEAAGRNLSRATLTDLFASARTARLIGAGDPSEMATQYLGLLWEDLMVSLLLGLASTPKAEEIKRRAGKATSAFMQLHALAS